MQSRSLLPRSTLSRCLTAGLALVLLALSSALYAGGVTYTYDTLGRLTRATYTNGVVIVYVYDAAGNRTSYTVSGVL